MSFAKSKVIGIGTIAKEILVVIPERVLNEVKDVRYFTSSGQAVGMGLLERKK